MATTQVTLDGEVHGYPPFHNHHSHVYPGGTSWMTGSIQLNHQDRFCGDLNLDKKCLLTPFPASYGVLVDNRSLIFEGLFNDVRDAGSANLSWYVEVVVRISPQRQRNAFRAVHMWYSGHYFSRNTERFYTFEVPANNISVTWTHTVPSITVDVLVLWLHSHENTGFLESWFFDTHPTKLGLDIAPYIMPVCEPFLPLAHGLTMANVQQHILTSAHAEQTRTGQTLLRCVATKAEATTSSTGDRQPTWRCHEGLNSRLVAGMNFTTVTFLDTHTPGNNGTVPMHMHFQAYVVPPGPAMPFTKTVDNPVSDGTTALAPSGFNYPEDGVSIDFAVAEACPNLLGPPNPPTVPSPRIISLEDSGGIKKEDNASAFPSDACVVDAPVAQDLGARLCPPRNPSNALCSGQHPLLDYFFDTRREARKALGIANPTGTFGELDNLTSVFAMWDAASRDISLLGLIIELRSAADDGCFDGLETGLIWAADGATMLQGLVRYRFVMHAFGAWVATRYGADAGETLVLKAKHSFSMRQPPLYWPSPMHYWSMQMLLEKAAAFADQLPAESMESDAARALRVLNASMIAQLATCSALHKLSADETDQGCVHGMGHGVFQFFLNMRVPYAYSPEVQFAFKAPRTTLTTRHKLELLEGVEVVIEFLRRHETTFAESANLNMMAGYFEAYFAIAHNDDVEAWLKANNPCKRVRQRWGDHVASYCKQAAMQWVLAPNSRLDYVETWQGRFQEMVDLGCQDERSSDAHLQCRLSFLMNVADTKVEPSVSYWCALTQPSDHSSAFDSLDGSRWWTACVSFVCGLTPSHSAARAHLAQLLRDESTWHQTLLPSHTTADAICEHATSPDLATGYRPSLSEEQVHIFERKVGAPHFARDVSVRSGPAQEPPVRAYTGPTPPGPSQWRLSGNTLDRARTLESWARRDAECEWRRSSLDEAKVQMHAGVSKLKDGSPSAATNATGVMFCDLVNHTHTLKVMRIGPFRFAPTSSVYFSYRPQQPKWQPNLFLVGSFVAMLDPLRGYAPLPFPPLHNHHTASQHVGDPVPEGWGNNSEAIHWVNTGPSFVPLFLNGRGTDPGSASDFACPHGLRDHGEPLEAHGNICMGNWYPGCGKRVYETSKPYFTALFNDVRSAADSMTESLEPYDGVFEYLAVFEHSGRNLPEIHPMQFNVGFPLNAATNPFSVYTVTPEMGPTMHWREFTMPTAGRVGSSRFHHHDFTREMWVVAGTAQDLGIQLADIPPAIRDDPKWREHAMDGHDLRRGLIQPMPVNDTGAMMARLNTTLMQANQAARAASSARQLPRILCRLMSVDSDTVRPYGANQKVASTSGSESVVLIQGEESECNNWAWEADDSFVIVAFNAPVNKESTGHSHWVMQPILDSN